MIDIEYTNKYRHSQKKFLKNNPVRAIKTQKAINLFIQVQSHPGLNLEKLKGLDVWTIRIDKGNRIFFTWIGIGKALLLDIGPHDLYRFY